MLLILELISISRTIINGVMLQRMQPFSGSINPISVKLTPISLEIIMDKDSKKNFSGLEQETSVLIWQFQMLLISGTYSVILILWTGCQLCLKPLEIMYQNSGELKYLWMTLPVLMRWQMSEFHALTSLRFSKLYFKCNNRTILTWLLISLMDKIMLDSLHRFILHLVISCTLLRNS